jgi:hypothetical protein
MRRSYVDKCCLQSYGGGVCSFRYKGPGPTYAMNHVGSRLAVYIKLSWVKPSIMTLSYFNAVATYRIQWIIKYMHGVLCESFHMTSKMKLPKFDPNEFNNRSKHALYASHLERVCEGSSLTSKTTGFDPELN